MNKKKILITGFPHTGTSILKSKFGECKNVYEVANECDFITPSHIYDSRNAEYVLIKSPIIPINIRANDVRKIRLDDSVYKDYIIIFVTRNPYNVFTSIIKSGQDPLTKCDVYLDSKYHFRISEYIASLQIIKNVKTHNIPNTYSIKYEDFFDNDGNAIKDIMDSIGLQYDDDIFHKKTKEYIHSSGVNFKDIDISKISYKENRLAYRTWQINQPFQNMNSEVNIPDELSDILKNSNIVQELGYSDPRITR